MSTLRAPPRAARPPARAVRCPSLAGAPRARPCGRVPARPRLAPVSATRPDASSLFDDDDDRRYPFIASEFTRVVPAVVGRGARDAARGAGFIVFAEVAPCGGPVDGDASPRALSMDIGGDALLALLLGAARDEEEEDEEVEAPPDVPPLALDLLWSVLQRGRQLSKTAWHLQRVAVVDEKGGAYVARLFFGPPAPDSDDARPPPSSWELKCRPSDASWLALQADCPLYIRRDIFDARSVPLDALLRAVDEADDDSDDDDGSDDEHAPHPPAAAAFEPPPPAVAHVASLAPGDPDGIVLLKRALALAVRDEDFATAARVRDHPAMAAYARAAALDAAGDAAGAAAARREVEDALAGRPTVAPKPTRARRPARGGGGGGEGRANNNNNSKGRVRGRKPREQGPEA